jgi:hypothetical protein
MGRPSMSKRCGWIGPGDTCSYPVAHEGSHSWEGPSVEEQPGSGPRTDRDRLFEDVDERYGRNVARFVDARFETALPEPPKAALRVNYNLGRTHGYEEGLRAARAALPEPSLDVERLAEALVASGLMERFLGYAIDAHRRTMSRKDTPADLALYWARPIAVAYARLVPSDREAE